MHAKAIAVSLATALSFVSASAGTDGSVPIQFRGFWEAEGVPCDDPDHVNAIEIEEHAFYFYEGDGRVEKIVVRSAEEVDVKLLMTEVDGVQSRTRWRLRLSQNGARLALVDGQGKEFVHHRCRAATS
jgi:hypothetical protein